MRLDHVHYRWTYDGLTEAMRQKLTTRTIKALRLSETPYEVRDTEIKGFLLRVQPSGTMTFYLDYRTPEGTRNRYRIGKLGTIRAAQARDIAEKLAGKVAHGIDLQAEKKTLKSEAKRRALNNLEAFLAKSYRPWAETHRKSWKQTITRIKAHFQDLMNRPLEDINQWVLEKWRTKRIKDGISPVTVNRDIAALKGVLSKAVEWGVLDVHPLARLKPSPVDHSANVRFLSVDEEKRLREALSNREILVKAERISANQWRKKRGYEEKKSLKGKAFVDHLQPMVLLAMNTGLRRGEIFRLEWADLDLKKKILTIHGGHAKTGRTRHVPLNTEALNVLQQWGKTTAKSGLVFPNKDGQPFDNIKRAWGTLLKEAKIEKFRFHDLRHHFASKLVMAEVDLNTVRELLGHSDIKMTLRYAHLAPEHKANAVEKLLSASAK